MKKISYLFSAAAVALLLQSCAGPASNTTEETVIDSLADSTKAKGADTVSANLEDNEMTFAVAAATGGMMEVESATVAIQQTQNASIKAFATKMLNDHRKANTELAAIAANKQLAIPKVLPEEHAMHIADLKKLSGRQFDIQYMTMMIADHAKTVKLFSEGAALPDADLKRFATATLPVISAHYAEAVKIGKTLNLNNSGNGDDLQGVSPAAGNTN